MADRLSSFLAATLLAFSACGEGSLVWCFEGRDFDSWRAAAPILTQHWAQASFKVTGEFDAAARQVQSELAAYPDFFQVAPDFARLADGYAEEYHPVVSAWTARKFAGADFGRLDAAVTGRLAAVVARLAREDEVTCCRFRGPIDLAALKFVVTAAEKSRVWVRGIHACPEESRFAFTRQRLFPGFDGKFCKTSPCVATDWRGTALLTYDKLLLSGCDVTYGQYLCRSTDGGRTWSAPKRVEAFPDRFEHGHRITTGAGPRYSRHYDRWFGLGCTQTMMGDQRPMDGMVNGRPTMTPIWATLDAERGEYGPARQLPFPLPYSKALPFGEPVETEDGELIVPFYFCGVESETKADAWSPVSEVVCVSYRFVGDELKVARVGRPLAVPELKRGLCEPSLVRFKGRYYLTLRSDEYGAWTESADGLNFGEVRPWV